MTVQKSLSGRLPCDTPALPVSLNRKHRKGAVLWLSPALYFLQNKEMLSCTPAGKGVKGNDSPHNDSGSRGTHTHLKTIQMHTSYHTHSRDWISHTLCIFLIHHTYIHKPIRLNFTHTHTSYKQHKCIYILNYTNSRLDFTYTTTHPITPYIHT